MELSPRKVVCWAASMMLVLCVINTVVGSVIYDGSYIDRADGKVDNSLRLVPQNYRHRPIVEFFTGLSCSACMGGPHHDLERLWDESCRDMGQPFTYIEFHELNGKGVDDLATNETLERMRYYQPGVSGTPDAEFDGGYIELGGLTNRGVDYASANQAINDSATRYEIKPSQPLQSLRSSFKFVELFVDQVFTGDGFAVSVQVHYLGSSAILPLQQLRGSLYVFMVEDNVTANSVILEKNVTSRNVFRGYAIKDQQFTLTYDKTYATTVAWTIPKANIPIKPGDITAVAAVYDLGDTSSGEGVTGNKAQVPRCIQSATFASTAFDRHNDLPVVSSVDTQYDSNLKINVKIDDSDGIAEDGAYLLYNFKAPNSTLWFYTKMNVTGDEICNDSGTCRAYGNGTAAATIPLEKGKTAYFMILIYDGSGAEYGSLGAQGKSSVYNYTASGAVKKDSFGGLFSFELIGLVLGICLVAFAVYIIFIKRRRITETGEVVSPTKPPREGMRKKTLIIIMAITIVVILILSTYAFSLMGGGEQAPNFSLTDINGNKFSLSDFKGKVVVLDFMATWCPTCNKVMDTLKAINEKYKDNIVMITIDIDKKESDQDLKTFKEKYEADWIFARDTAGLITKYHVDTIPKLVIVDKNGGITFTHAGDISESKLSEEIDKAIGGGAPLTSLGATTLGLAGFAVVVGVGSFFSPCSFPLLPGYMSYYLGLRESRNVRRALLGGLSAALGLILLYILIGILVGVGGSAITPYASIIEPFVGIIIIILGIALLANYTIPFYRITEPIKRRFATAKKITSKIPTKTIEKGIQKMVSTDFTFKSAKEGGYFGLFLYGIGYGSAAAGCTAPLLLAITLAALTAGGFLNALLIFTICAIVMAILMIFVTLILAMSAGNLLQKLKVSTLWIKRVSGLILVVVGAYLLIYYFTSFG